MTECEREKCEKRVGPLGLWGSLRRKLGRAPRIEEQRWEQLALVCGAALLKAARPEFMLENLVDCFPPSPPFFTFKGAV